MKKKIVLQKLGGYYLMPHELLHVLAYRIIGKPSQYQWGNYYVMPLGKMTRPQRLFTSLFPFIICLGTGLFFILTWMTIAFFYHQQPNPVNGSTWQPILLLFGIGLAFYSTTAEGDIMNSYHLLFTKEQSQNSRPKPHGGPDNDSH